MRSDARRSFSIQYIVYMQPTNPPCQPPTKLVQYMYAVAEASDRITIEEYARTYENRPLLLLTISSKENIQNIDQSFIRDKITRKLSDRP